MRPEPRPLARDSCALPRALQPPPPSLPRRAAACCRIRLRAALPRARQWHRLPLDDGAARTPRARPRSHMVAASDARVADARAIALCDASSVSGRPLAHSAVAIIHPPTRPSHRRRLSVLRAAAFCSSARRTAAARLLRHSRRCRRLCHWPSCQTVCSRDASGVEIDFTLPPSDPPFSSDLQPRPPSPTFSALRFSSARRAAPPW